MRFINHILFVSHSIGTRVRPQPGAGRSHAGQRRAAGLQTEGVAQTVDHVEERRAKDNPQQEVQTLLC